MISLKFQVFNQAISNVILVAEVIKTQIFRLHLINTIDFLIRLLKINIMRSTKEESPIRNFSLKNEPKNKTFGYQKALF